MIEETARVVGVEGAEAWVETQRQNTCGSCAVNKGCGTSVLAKILGRKRTLVRVMNPIGARLGDEVVVGIEEGALVRGSMALYGLPLLTLLVGAIVGEALSSSAAAGSELFGILGGLGGLAAGLAWVRGFATRARGDRRYQPVILRRAPEMKPAVHGVLAP
jgi:sigma-E factor negative regulatory protein RseC